MNWNLSKFLPEAGACQENFSVSKSPSYFKVIASLNYYSIQIDFDNEMLPPKSKQ